MIIAIDGPAGSGKSSTARVVARELGFRHLDSGAFYRALTFVALRSHVPPTEWDRLNAERLDAFHVHAQPVSGGYRLYTANEDITDALRTPDVNQHVSAMARVPAVREWLLDQLRDAARLGNLVADGRDIGTVVFPNAELKVFLVANPVERARRRLLEQGKDPNAAGVLDTEIERLGARDKVDSERETAPLLQAPDAILVDTTTLTFDEQVDRIVGLARERMTSTASD